jgi:two-component system nitrogen regulation sensor histidine kinase NtrY
MAEDLEAGQKRLLDAQERMAQQYEELERRGRYIEAVLDNITSGVISTDASGRIGTVNKAAEAMLGVNAEQLVGRKAQHLVRGEFAELLTGALKHLAKVPEARWTRQIDLQLKDRGARFLVNLVGLTGGDAQAEGTGLVAVFEDITELEKVQRQAAWREVAQRIAHEIKNPLTPIKLSAQRLMRKYSAVANDKSFDDCAALIVREVERLQQMVAEFSGYAKLPEVQPVLASCPRCSPRWWAPSPRRTGTSAGSWTPHPISPPCPLTPRACARCSSTCSPTRPRP